MNPDRYNALARFFAEHPAPPSRTIEWDTWLESVRDVADSATEELVELLHRGSDVQQYGSVVALRHLGHEVWATGYGTGLKYALKLAGSPEVITIEPDVY